MLDIATESRQVKLSTRSEDSVAADNQLDRSLESPRVTAIYLTIKGL